MNLASECGNASNGVFFVSFNQDSTSLAIGTKSGYRIYCLNSVDDLRPIYENDTENVFIVERLFSSALIALVSFSSPRKLQVFHFKRGTEICNYSYSNTILAVKLNRLRLVVCLEESLYVHNLKDMKVIHTISDTPANPRGLFALSTSSEYCFLAYPGSTSTGEVQIFDASNLQAKLIIPAHDNPMAAMTFDPSGKKLATASGKGTVIRVFNVLDGTKLFEFRRGMKRCVDIYSLAFSADSTFLSASSNTETVHIFKLEDPNETPKSSEEPQGWMDYFGKALMSSASYLPTQVSDMLNQERALATAQLPFSGLRTVCALALIQQVPRVLVASADGYLYIYNVNLGDGADCTLVKQIKLVQRRVVIKNRFDRLLWYRLDAGLECEGGIPCETSAASGEHSKSGGGASGMASYAAILRNAQKQEPASPYHDLVAASGGLADSPPKGLSSPLMIDDENEFPPVTQRIDL